MSVHNSKAWSDLVNHSKEISQVHLKDLLSDSVRNASFQVEFDDILLDFSRQTANSETMVRINIFYTNNSILLVTN